MGRFLLNQGPILSVTGQVLSGLGAGSSVLGAAASYREAKGVYEDLRSGGYTGEQKALGAGQVASSGASVFQQLATSAYHISNLAGSEAAAFAAQSATGGAAAVMGGVDVLRGAYGFFKARQNIERLNRLKETERLDANTMKAVEQASAAQASKKKASVGTFLKGGLGVAGGVLLALSASTPIGWVLLSAGALLGGAFAIWKWWDKRKRKKAIAMKEFGIEEERNLWEKRVEAVKDRYWWWDKKGKAKRAALGIDPLERELKARGFKDASHFYANHITTLADDLYARAGHERANLESYIETEVRRQPYIRGNMTPSEMKKAPYTKLIDHMEANGIREENMNEASGKHYKVIEALFDGMGIKFEWKGREPQPTAQKIGKALDS